VVLAAKQHHEILNATHYGSSSPLSLATAASSLPSHYEEQAVNMASKKCPDMLDRPRLHMDCPMGWNGHLTACPVDSVWTSPWTLSGPTMDSLLDTNWTLTWTQTGHLHGHKSRHNLDSNGHGTVHNLPWTLPEHQLPLLLDTSLCQ